ncbi:MAG: cation:proton antiporter [Gemmatimonadota bacterium]|nr:cation:proton antiporter [Gemmatimonadota bacterium]
MSDASILRDLGVILVAAAAFAILARSLRIPSIVAYILAGLLLGPVSGVLEVSEGVELASEIGIALLLFLVGLELSFAAIRDLGKVAGVGGTAQVVISALVGTGLAVLLGFPAREALFLGVALSFSSTVVVVKLLEQRGDLQDTYGRVTLGILLVQDLLVVVVLTFVSGLAREGSASLLRMAMDLWISFGGMAVLVVVAIGASRSFLPLAFQWIGRSPEATLIWSLSWCFLLILGAQWLGLSVELGAFLAGVGLAQLPFNDDLRRRVGPLVNFFIAVFFVTLGVHMDPVEALALWPSALALIAFVMIVKPMLLLTVIPRLGFGERTAALSGLTLAQTSEFSFILAGLGLSAGLIGEEILALIALIGLGTMGLSSGLILNSRRVYVRLRAAGLLKVFRAPHEGPRDREEAGSGHGPAFGLRDHVIVVGMNSLGQRIVEGLRQRGVATLAVDTDPLKLAEVDGPVLVGDTDDLTVLESAGIRRAELVVSALQIEGANNLLAYRCRTLGIPCSVHAFDVAVVPDLREIGATHLMDSKTAGTRRLTEALGAEGVYG